MSINNKIPRVEFRLFSLGNDNAIKLLSPEGTIVFQGIGFPIDFKDCTCLPIGPVSLWSKIEITKFDSQWYQPTQPIVREDIPDNLSGSPKIKGYLCHKLLSNTNIYPISSLYVDGSEVFSVSFENKKPIFIRLGNIVKLDLDQVPNGQRFTLSIEWSYTHIEIRASWLEGDGLEKHFSGNGISYEDLETYKQPVLGKLIQFKNRTEFSTSIIPTNIAKAIWKHSEKFIDDDIEGSPSQDVKKARKVYKDEEDFTKTLVNIFHEINKIIMKTKPHAFWNNNKPKSEPHAGASLRMIFEPLCSNKNIRVFQEDPSRSGNVDFVFTGISSKSDHFSLILELKNAHSDKLEKGITDQLPTYMNERNNHWGVYGVLWYKGKNFNFPSDDTIENCISRLEEIKHTLVTEIVVFDVSYHLPASRL